MSHCLYEYKCTSQHLEWLKNTVECCWICWGWTRRWNRKSASGGSLYRWRCGLLKLDSFYHNVRVGLNFNLTALRLTSNTGKNVYYWSSQDSRCHFTAVVTEIGTKPETPCRLLVKRTSLGSNPHQTGHHSITEHSVTPSILEKTPHKARIKPRTSIT